MSAVLIFTGLVTSHIQQSLRMADYENGEKQEFSIACLLFSVKYLHLFFLVLFHLSLL